jgi:AcrR family transcriptional regulator
VKRSATLEPRRRPVQARSIATVDAIVQAAAQVFAYHGYAAGTTNRIAERAGVSIGTLYQYFPNKDAILIALIEGHIREGEDILIPLLSDLVEHPPAPHDALRRIFDALLKLHAREPALHRVLFEEAPRSRRLLDHLAKQFDLASAALASYLDSRAEITVPDTQLAAQLVIQTAEAITHGLVIHPRSSTSPHTYAAETIRMLERYLTIPPSSRPRRGQAQRISPAAERSR